jgi:hypothetical protein
VPVLSHRPGRRARPRRRLLPTLGVVLAHVVAFAWLIAPATDSGAQPADDGQPVDLELSQTTGLTDGQVLDVTVRARPGVAISTNPTVNQSVYICRPGVTYTVYRDLLPAQGNCPFFLPVSSSSVSSRALYPLPDGSEARTSLPVGVGTVEWPLVDPSARLACDPDNPCLLVALVKSSLDGGPYVDTIATTELSFTAASPLTGCLPADAGITTAGSDRMQSWWTDLSVADCRGSGQVVSNFAPLGEAAAIASFAAGSRDIAYTASGRQEAVPEFDPPDQRAAVYTPVGINAAVIALVGGNPLHQDAAWPIGLPHPYDDIRLTSDEVATLLARGHTDFDTNYAEAIHARNPELPPGPLYWLADTSKVPGPIAVQDATSVTSVATAYLDALAPDEWRSPAGAGSFVDRGVFSSFANAEPAFQAMTEISTGSQLASLKNVTVQQTMEYSGPAWALTDYATAIELGLTPVSIENAAGEFVKPTSETLAAAVPTMTADADGRRTPDVSTAAAGAYPLTVVEYAMAPAEALLDDACAPRTGSQALLTSWLEYVTGPGQQELPAGLAPLTADLQSDAQASIPRVGASPSTATCAPPPTGPPANPPAAPAAVPAGGGLGGPGGTGLPGSRGPTSPSGTGAADAAIAPSSPDELAGAVELADAAKPTLPPFLGIRAVSEVISPVALLLIVALTASAAFTTSGRPLPAPVARAPGRAVSTLGRIARWRPRVRRRG